MKQIPQNEKPLKVIAAIPCFNTESSIDKIVRQSTKYVTQVIIIDDGSRDGTAEVAKRAGALVISHRRNLGYGESIKSCFEAARAHSADVLITIDGDGQHNPDDIPALLTTLLRGEADLVIGSRFIGAGVKIPVYRRFGISLINLIFNIGAKIKVSDTQSGFRGYGNKLISTLFPVESGMSSSLETLEKTRRTSAVIKEVAVSCYYPSSTFSPGTFWHGLGVALAGIKLRCLSLFTGDKP